MPDQQVSETTMRRLRILLSAGGGTVEPAAKPGKLILKSEKGALAITVEDLRNLANSGLLRRSGDRVELVEAVIPTDHSIGALRDEQNAFGEATVEADGIVARVQINLAESPLAQLYRRKAKDGRPFLARTEFEAGERLRSDYTRGRIMPRLGANWEAGVSGGRRSDGQGGADLTNASLAARQRVDRALKTVGPELGGLLVDICCFLKGIELVERERSWPVRSGKIVLKTALGVLARHYNPTNRSKSHHDLHWGSDEYRPSIS